MKLVIVVNDSLMLHLKKKFGVTLNCPISPFNICSHCVKMKMVKKKRKLYLYTIFSGYKILHKEK